MNFAILAKADVPLMSAYYAYGCFKHFKNVRFLTGI